MWLILQHDTPDDWVIATGETHSVEEFAKKAFEYASLDWKEYVITDEKYFRPNEVNYLLGDSSKARKGYSGTAILSKKSPSKTSNDIGIFEHDQEGRVIKAEFENFNLINVYVPNSGQELKRLDYRKKWDEDFLNFCLESEKEKPTIITGDLNVAHKEIDIARPKPNYNKSAGYTQTEIDGLQRFLDSNFIDIYREKNPENIKYSWWNYRFRSRERNVGWRIDYFLISPNLSRNILSTEIHNEYFGSDHCPVSLELAF